jgi:hypothetical protein
VEMGRLGHTTLTPEPSCDYPPEWMLRSWCAGTLGAAATAARDPHDQWSWDSDGPPTQECTR